jgi:hypothetical protein
MNTKSKYRAIYNIIFGLIFLLVFGTIFTYGCIWISVSTNGYQSLNAVFTLIIGALGALDGIRLASKGYRFIIRDKLV